MSDVHGSFGTGYEAKRWTVLCPLPWLWLQVGRQGASCYTTSTLSLLYANTNKRPLDTTMIGVRIRFLWA